MSPETPKPKPSNPGAGEKMEIKGLTPEQRKKDQQLMDKLLTGIPGYKPRTEKAKKGKEAVDTKQAKLKKGTKEYKKRLAELTDITLDKSKSDKVLAELDKKPSDEEITGGKSPAQDLDKRADKAAKKAQSRLAKGPQAGTNKKEKLS